jgi:hypothetical protein
MKKATPKKKAQKKVSSRKSETDWKRIHAMKDEDIDFADRPEVTAEMMARGVVRRNLKVVERKKAFPLLLDSEVYWWFLKQGLG